MKMHIGLISTTDLADRLSGPMRTMDASATRTMRILNGANCGLTASTLSLGAGKHFTDRYRIASCCGRVASLTDTPLARCMKKLVRPMQAGTK